MSTHFFAHVSRTHGLILLAVRYRTLCPVGPPLDTQWLNAPEFAQSSKKLGIGKFMMIIKTWANSWSTSDRYHEETRLPCIMGCQCFVSCEDDAKDVLAHYLECPILWTVINSAALTLQRPQEGSAECRACLCNPTLNDFKRLVVAFNVYHSLRLGHRTVVASATRSCK